MVAVVAVEIFPEALDVAPPWMLGVSFLVGGLLYLAAEWLIEDRLLAGREGSARMWWNLPRVPVPHDGVRKHKSSQGRDGILRRKRTFLGGWSSSLASYLPQYFEGFQEGPELQEQHHRLRSRLTFTAALRFE